MKHIRTVVAFLALFAGHEIIAQTTGFKDVTWACEVVACSQEYKGEKWTAKQVLGEPDVFLERPRASSMSYLFGFHEPSDKEVSGEAFIEVAFCKTHKANRVVVAESNAPGAITKIELIDTEGKKHLVYEQKELVKIKAVKRLLEVTFPETKYLVKGVRITGTPGDYDNSWNAIDGIGIVNSPTPVQMPLQLQNLGPMVNSKYNETAPRVSADGKTLYFAVGGHPDNVGKYRLDDDLDIFVSEMDEDGNWSEARSMGKPWNHDSYNWVASIGGDGNTVYLSGRYTSTGARDGTGVSVSNRTASGWSIPKNIEIIGYKNKANTVDFFMTNDLEHLLISCEGGKTVGEHDLYVSKRINAYTYDKPMNLGKVINTKMSEYAPFLAADGKTLYFSSDKKGGYGSFDIYMSKRLDDTWTNWSEPVNLGSDINTDGFDSDFSISARGDWAFMTRKNDSYGDGDIFGIPLKPESQPSPVVLIRGKVIDKKTNQPVGASILYETLATAEKVGTANANPQTGDYSIILPYEKAYALMAESEGYYAINENIDLTEISEYKEIEMDLYLVPIEVGEVIRLNNIFFDFGKYDLLPNSYPELNRVVKLLQDNPNVKIEMAGHTDNVGSDGDNQTLSENRAKAVVGYLISKGIVADRLVAKGYGESKPVTTNETEEGRLFNRRVEFTIINQ